MVSGQFVHLPLYLKKVVSYGFRNPAQSDRGLAKCQVEVKRNTDGVNVFNTTYKNVKVGDADATLGTSVGESGDTVYILSWEQGGVSNTIMGNISRDEIVRIAENIF